MLILYTQRRPVTDSGKEATSDAELQELMFSERTFSPRDKRQKGD